MQSLGGLAVTAPLFFQLKQLSQKGKGYVSRMTLLYFRRYNREFQCFLLFSFLRYFFCRLHLRIVRFAGFDNIFFNSLRFIVGDFFRLSIFRVYL